MRLTVYWTEYYGQEMEAPGGLEGQELQTWLQENIDIGRGAMMGFEVTEWEDSKDQAETATPASG